MSPTRALARPLLSATFVAGGVDALRDPAPRVALVTKAGLTEPENLVRVNAGAQVIGGLAVHQIRPELVGAHE